MQTTLKAYYGTNQSGSREPDDFRMALCPLVLNFITVIPPLKHAWHPPGSGAAPDLSRPLSLINTAPVQKIIFEGLM